MTDRSRRWARAVALVAVAVLALGAAGCGDDNDDGANSGGEASGRGGEHTGRAAEINEVLVAVQKDFVDLDGTSYCDRLTAAGKRQVERFGEAFVLGEDCVAIINAAAKRTRDAGVKQRPTKLVSVEFKGDRAIATIRNGGRPPQPMVFVDKGGEWKIPDPGFQTKVGGEFNSRPLSSDPAKRFRQVKRTSDAVKKGKPSP